MAKHEWELVLQHFVDLYQIMEEKGQISDEEFIRRGFPPDMDSNGDERYRPSNLSAGEHMHRAKIFDHPYQRSLRKAAIQNALDAELSKANLEKEKSRRVLAANLECERKLQTLIGGKETSESCSVADAELWHFQKCKKPQLQAFIIARLTEDVSKTVNIPKNKGKLAKAEVDGAETLVRRAYDLRGHDLKLKDKVSEPETPVDAAFQSSFPHAEVATVYQVPGIQEYQFSPTNNFVELLKQAFDPNEITKIRLVDLSDPDALAQLQQRTVMLHDILQQRLTRHIQERVKDKSKHDHWVWTFARRNIGRVAAAMVAFGHVRKDLTTAKRDFEECLLAGVSKGSFISIETIEVRNMEGCYLWYDTERECWVRSGKAVGADRSFGVRGSEHHERALQQSVQDLDSYAYNCYPSSRARTHVKGEKRGDFEDLQTYCALGFSRKFESSLDTICEIKEEGDCLLEWDKVTVQRMKKLKLGGDSLRETQLHFVGFLLELCYDLALSPKANVSRSPGFEAPLGIYK